MAKRVVIRTNEDARRYLQETNCYVAIKETKQGPVVVESAACNRCGGLGRGPWFPDGGICYQCRGANTTQRTKSTPLVKFARKERDRNRRIERAREEQRKRNQEAHDRMIEGQRNWCEKHGYGRITFAERDVIKEEERKRKAEKKGYVGEVKERRDFTVTLNATFDFDTKFGSMTIYKFEDENENTVVWKTSAAIFIESEDGSRSIRKGDVVTIRATVKEHSTFRDEPQTVISRAKLIKTEKTMEAA